MRVGSSTSEGRPYALSEAEPEKVGDSATTDDAESGLLRVSAYGLSANDEALLHAIVGVLDGRTKPRWKFATLALADAVVVPDAVLSMPQSKSSLQGRLLIVQRTGVGAATRHDDVTLDAPISVMNVMDALNAAGMRLLQPCYAKGRADVPTLPVAADKFSLASAIVRLAGESPYRRVRTRITDFGSLSICFTTKHYQIDFAHDQLANAVRERRYVLTAVQDKNIDHGDAAAPMRPLIELFWIAGTSPCADMELGVRERFRMVQWPNFPRLKHSVDHIQLCVRLSGCAMTLGELADESGFPEMRVAAFLRACLLCGYVVRDAGPENLFEARSLPSKAPRGGFLERFLKHFRA